MSLWSAVALLILQEIAQAAAELCETYGHYCEKPYRCCGSSCCRDPAHDDHYNYGYTYRWSIWNMWYFWFLVIFVLMSCFGGCGYWRRRQWMLANQQRTTSQPSYPSRSQSAQYRTAVFGYAAPFGMQQSTPAQPQGAFPSPPPYSEVVNKPDVYPPKKDELPPYPGGPMPMYGEGVPAYAWLGSSANTYNSGGENSPYPPSPLVASGGMTGLPSYTQVATSNATAASPQATTANQDAEASAGATNQQTVTTSSAANQCPSNQSNQVTTASANQNGGISVNS